jgi:hypothetical protein
MNPMNENPGGRPPKFRGRRGPERGPRRLAAEAAGLSRHQMRQALAVGAVPDDVFEALVESDNPPTVTALAELGRGRAREASTAPAPVAAALLALSRRVARLARLLGNPAAFEGERAALVRELQDWRL